MCMFPTGTTFVLSDTDGIYICTMVVLDLILRGQKRCTFSYIQPCICNYITHNDTTLTLSLIHTHVSFSRYCQHAHKIGISCILKIHVNVILKTLMRRFLSAISQVFGECQNEDSHFIAMPLSFPKQLVGIRERNGGYDAE